MPEHTFKFHSTGEDYSGFVAACKWLQRKGYSYGFLEGHNPIGIIKQKNWLIQRFSKLSYNKKAMMDGWILFPYGHPRTSDCVIKMRDE